MPLNQVDISMMEDIPAPGPAGKIIISDGTDWTSGENAPVGAIVRQATDPTPTDPATPTLGDMILNTGNGKLFNCTDATAGAAVWIDVLPAAGADGQVLTSDGTNWASEEIDALPAAGATGQVLTSDGSTWASAAAPVSSTSVLEYNIAMLAFKLASANQLAKFAMVDQVIDEYQDSTGIDEGNSTNEFVGGGATAKYFEGGSSGSEQTVVKSYTGANQTFVVPSGVNTINFIAWGAAGGGGSTSYGGGGGFIEGDVTVYPAETLNVKVGGGGNIAHSGASQPGGGGGGTGIYRSSTVLAIAGAGGGGENNIHGVPGGGLTGANGNLATGSIPANGGTQTSGGAAVDGGGAGYLNVGGSMPSSSSTAAGGYNGGGSGDGDNVTHTGGGGGAGYYGGSSSGTGTHHGSGAGGSSLTAGTNTQGSAGTVANAGHANYASSTGNGVTAAAGQHGHAVIKYTTVNSGQDLILQSNEATNAPTVAPTTGDLVVLIDDGGSGTTTEDVNVKAYISRNGNFNTLDTDHVQAEFTDEGSWGTAKQRILVSRNVDISGITTGTSMKYRITTHSQSAGTMETQIHATSLAWA